MYFCRQFVLGSPYTAYLLLSSAATPTLYVPFRGGNVSSGAYQRFPDDCPRRFTKDWGGGSNPPEVKLPFRGREFGPRGSNQRFPEDSHRRLCTHPNGGVGGHPHTPAVVCVSGEAPYLNHQ